MLRTKLSKLKSKLDSSKKQEKAGDHKQLEVTEKSHPTASAHVTPNSARAAFSPSAGMVSLRSKTISNGEAKGKVSAALSSSHFASVAGASAIATKDGVKAAADTAFSMPFVSTALATTGSASNGALQGKTEIAYSAPLIGRRKITIDTSTASPSRLFTIKSEKLPRNALLTATAAGHQASVGSNYHEEIIKKPASAHPPGGAKLL